jgi:hypothetical protein
MIDLTKVGRLNVIELTVFEHCRFATNSIAVVSAIQK